MKIIDTQQAELCNIYKNTRLKLLETNTALWFNKMCRIKQLKPNFIHFKSMGKTSHDRKTMSNAVRYRINQEIKFLCCNRQNLNIQLYQIQLKCANQCNSVWQHIQNSIDSKLNENMGTLYHKL